MEAPPAGVRVWDLPTRVFHWLLATLVVFSFASAKIGGAWTEWHFRSGYTILALLVFRLLWGCAGSHHARFANFVRGPRTIVSYLRGRTAAGDGHDPLGGWSVTAMLVALLVQASAGLFANDAIASEGPLAKLVSATVSDRLTTVHRWGEKLLIALVVLHVCAVFFLQFVRGRRLLMPMLTGDRPGQGTPARDDAALRTRALLLAALAAGFVAYVVTL
jgi:cytochrome b